MSRRLVARLSRLVDRHASRRGFLRTSAITATAMAFAPVAFAVRPITAEAAIRLCRGIRCDRSSLCCDDWTEFCCTLTGENTCPPGTVVAGWWKVDDSKFCSIDEPRPRYYLDCNLECDPGCVCTPQGMCSKSCTKAKCECPHGCDSRKVDCSRFRYGQCNQDICVGAVRCRVVTCVPPWQWDPECQPAPVLRSPSTRLHDRRCLHTGFTDVPPRAFYAESVDWMTAEGITKGLTDDLFGPDEPIGRGQFASFVWRYEGRPRPASSGYFSDVPDGSDHARAVDWMAEQGIAARPPNRRFQPQSALTQAHAVVLLYRLAGSPPVLTHPHRGDIAEHGTQQTALHWAMSNGIVRLSSSVSSWANQTVSRGQAAHMMHRYHLTRRPAAGVRHTTPRPGPERHTPT